jgi:competence CoiA-like predicted nuclease
VQLQKKQAKEAEIEANADADIAKQRQSKQLNVTDGDLASFRKWYIQYQKDKWHKFVQTRALRVDHGV